MNAFRLSAVASLLSAAIVVTAVPTAAAASVSPTQLTGAFVGDMGYNATIAKGQTVTFVGRLASTTSLSGYTLTLYARTSPSKPWTNLRSLVTNSRGKVSQNVTPNYSTQLQWRFAGEGGHAASSSPIFQLIMGMPPTLLTAITSAGPLQTETIPQGMPTTISGHLADLQFGSDIPNATLDLYARGSSSKPWVKLKTVTTSSIGWATQIVTPNYTVQLQWRFAGSSMHLPSSSPVFTLITHMVGCD